ncbi:TonB-dependent receptor SusC precursor [mine drainage metagenome]|uniref:TonB-dependent receptor SusC n=1 Tax=mine drainage metagenome TaxID=410659 RepID=A0A1J5SJ18_9ZZZZ
MKKNLCLILLWCISATTAFSQNNKQVKGRVTDDNGAALQFASVMIGETKKGTQTDSTGHFAINIPNDGKKYNLIISYVGFVSKTVPVVGNDIGTIKMQRQASEAEDVVVIGYQTVRRKDVLASVSSISAKDLKDIPINSAAEALAGRLAGVQVTSSEGSPDADVKIRVRGGGSITQDNSPLYIIDGVQVENGLSTLSPQDIQTIDVLKDAAATAIYGARGANGVVIITTKSGKANNRLTVSYNGFYGIKNLTKTLDVLSPYEMVMFEYERTRPSSVDSATFASRYGTTFDTLSVYKKTPFVNWQKQVLGNTGFSQTHNISVGGGNAKTTFNLSYTHNDEKAIVQNSAFRRDNVLFRLDHKNSDKLKIGVAVRVTNQNVYGAGVSTDNGSAYNRLRNSVKYRPFLSTGINSLDQIDPSLVDNNVGNGLNLVNPIALNNAEYQKKSTMAYNVTGYATYQIAKNFSFKTTVGVDNNVLINRVFEDSITPVAVIQDAAKPVAELDTTTKIILNNSNVFSYSLKGFKKNNDIDIILGEETYRLTTKTSTNIWGGYPTFTSPEVAFASTNILGKYYAAYPKYVVTDYTSLSFFGSARYSYKQKYLLSMNLRADGSSKFAPNVRWGYFPSGSVAWRVSREKFMENIKFINDLKIRLGYGTVGNNRIADYLYISTFNPNTYYYGMNGQQVYGYTPASLANPNLKWETTINRNAGIDIAFLRSRLNLSVDYYSNSTSDLLINTPIASTYGYASQLQNIGSTSNKGWEFQLNANIVQKKAFTWNANFNISFNQNRIESLAQGQTSFLTTSGWGVSGQPADYIVKVGESVGSMYGLVTDGIYQVSDFDYNQASKTYTLKAGVVSDAAIIGPPQPGMLKLKDLNGDGVVDLNNDRTIIGNANPKFQGGLNQQFVYKNFDASIFINFVYGNNIYNANKIEFTNGYTPNSNLLAVMQDRWRTVDNTGAVVTDPAALTALNANAKIWRPITSAGAFYLHSWAIEDGSFLRINNVSFGYTIKTNKLKTAGISRLRFYTTVNNLAIFTKYSGYDPEVNVRYSNPLTPGLDYSAYPKSRSIIFGVNVSFQ